ncbi:MAG TPA: hypothetical protein VGD87_11090 [Archangium sp.]
MRRLVLLGWLFALSGCPFFFGPYEPEPTPDDDGGTFVSDDDGGIIDAGPRGFDKATCTWNGKKLSGRIRWVTTSPDVRVRVVTSLPRLRVKLVDSLANQCGEWEIVDSFADLRVMEVTSLADLTIEYVTSFPGVN